jgi:hypothetical protein
MKAVVRLVLRLAALVVAARAQGLGELRRVGLRAAERAVSLPADDLDIASGVLGGGKVAPQVARLVAVLA